MFSQNATLQKENNDYIVYRNLSPVNHQAVITTPFNFPYVLGEQQHVQPTLSVLNTSTREERDQLQCKYLNNVVQYVT